MISRRCFDFCAILLHVSCWFVGRHIHGRTCVSHFVFCFFLVVVGKAVMKRSRSRSGGAELGLGGTEKERTGTSTDCFYFGICRTKQTGENTHS